MFPELCVTGYTCSDLFYQRVLLNAAEKSVEKILKETADLDIISIAGVPVAIESALYNCAAVIYKGDILGIVPKVNIPNCSEFYEVRHYTSGKNIYDEISYAGVETIISDNLVFCCDKMRDFSFGVEVCEDLWVAASPSVEHAKHGATVICNPSTSDDVIGKAQYRRDLVKMQSGKLCCAYIYSDSGFGESTTDMVFSGQNIISENASLLAESKRFTTGIIYADIDVRKLSAERRKTNTFTKSDDNNFTSVYFDMPLKHTELTREFSQTPFIPSNKSDLDARCEEIITMQATGLATRLAHTGIQNAVLGLSGGLDSTLALIVCVHAFDMLGIDRKNIHTVTMPCFGTTKRTKSNAQLLAEAYGVSFEDINITKAVRQHFADINHDESVTNITYENSQARERTQILMDLSNKYNGLVIGTGDLSELALGWATYNGDHMSNYAVNCSVPKTLVKYIVQAYASECASTDEMKNVLCEIADLPISPELLPPDKDGNIAQKTEESIGKYDLHDFFLYHFLRNGESRDRILKLAEIAFANVSKGEIEKTLETFFTRFRQQQFKRSCIPDGPKVGTVSLSPRGDLRMPSDMVELY